MEDKKCRIVIEIDEEKVAEYGSIFISAANPDPEHIKFFAPGFKCAAGALQVAVDSTVTRKRMKDAKKKQPQNKTAKKTQGKRKTNRR